MTISAHRAARQSVLAAFVFTVAMIAAPAWSQDNTTTVDCGKTGNTSDCINKPQSAAAAVPTKPPAQAMWPNVNGDEPSKPARGG